MGNPPIRAADFLAALLEKHTGQRLGEGRRWRIETLLRPLLRARALNSLEELVAALGPHPTGPLLDQTIDLMLNHESSFFRDLSVFESIETAILPLLRERASRRQLRIWSAGCATGMEAYSIAMMLKRMGSVWDGWQVTIVGTDVSPPAIAAAKRGRYSQMEVQRGLGVNDLLRWFTPIANEWQINAEIRDMVFYHADNVLEPRAVSGTFDLILCRNLLFYFHEEKRQLACKQIARHARPGTYLVVGASETLVGQESGFSACRPHRCIYVSGAPDRSDACAMSQRPALPG